MVFNCYGKGTREMNNEPVAIVKKITISGINNFPIERFTELKEGTLLYSSPRNLTDEEIDNAITEAFNRGARFGYAEGLKKASEK